MRARCMQSWSDETSDRPRVVIECGPEASPSIIADVVEREGMAVRTCVGASDRRCDLLDNGMCALVSGADVVVNLLGQHHETGRRIAEAVQSERRPPGLVVEVAAGDSPRHDVEFGEPIQLTSPLRSGALLNAIRDALASRGQSTSEP